MKKSKQQRKRLRALGWAGITMGKLDIDPCVSGGGDGVYGAVYRTRRDAKRRYQSVVRVVVRQV